MSVYRTVVPLWGSAVRVDMAGSTAFATAQLKTKPYNALPSNFWCARLVSIDSSCCWVKALLHKQLAIYELSTCVDFLHFCICKNCIDHS